MLKAIIFDMDGVLVDSEKIHFQSTSEMMKKHFGIELDFSYYKQFIGGTVTNMWNTLISDYSLDVTLSQIDEYADNILQEMIKESGYPAIAGVARFVRYIKENTDIRLAVASSAGIKRIEDNLVNLGLTDCFEVKMSGEQLGRSKPDPTIFLETVKKLGLECSECLVIEDSTNGILAAHNAGIPCLGFDQDGCGLQDMYKANGVFYSFESIDMEYIKMIYGHTVGEPVQILETERLRLREITTDDVDRLYELYNDENITKHMPALYEDKDMEIEYTKSYIENVYKFYHYGIWIVEEKCSGEIIGRVGVEYKEIEGITSKHELGYMVGREYQGKGYASEAIDAVIDYMKRIHGIEEFFVEISSDNEVSVHVAKKHGFIFDGRKSTQGYLVGILGQND